MNSQGKTLVLDMDWHVLGADRECCGWSPVRKGKLPEMKLEEEG